MDCKLEFQRHHFSSLSNFFSDLRVYWIEVICVCCIITSPNFIDWYSHNYCILNNISLRNESDNTLYILQELQCLWGLAMRQPTTHQQYTDGTSIYMPNTNFVNSITENRVCSDPRIKDVVPEEYLSHKERYENAVRKYCILQEILRNDIEKVTWDNFSLVLFYFTSDASLGLYLLPNASSFGSISLKSISGNLELLI